RKRFCQRRPLPGNRYRNAAKKSAGSDSAFFGALPFSGKTFSGISADLSGRKSYDRRRRNVQLVRQPLIKSTKIFSGIAGRNDNLKSIFFRSPLEAASFHSKRNIAFSDFFIQKLAVADL